MYRSVQRPSTLSVVCAPVSGVRVRLAVATNDHAWRVVGKAAAGILATVAREIQVQAQQSACTGANGFAAKDALTGKPAAGGVPPRGRPV